MKTYLSYFKLRFITSLQYRAAALAGIAAQVFFGLVFVMVYVAFYETGSGNNLPMNIGEIISYLWLNQIFYALIEVRYQDRDILKSIRTGDIAYELCRPQDLFSLWYVKMLANRMSIVLMRFLPVLIISFLLPSPYNLSLPTSIPAFLIFLLALIIGVFLSNSIIILFHILTLYTIDEKGVFNIIVSVSEILCGLIVPIAFFPKFLQVISNYLPFKYISDFSFRVYSGNISISSALPGLFIQVGWIIITTIIGYLLLRKATKRLVVQGG